MRYIKFRYRDEYTHGHWNEQECIVENLAECYKLYGLTYCEHEILENREVKE